MGIPWLNYNTFGSRICHHLTPFGIRLLMLVPLVVVYRNGVLRIDRVRLRTKFDGGDPYFRQILQIHVSKRARKIYNGRIFMARPRWAGKVRR